MPFDVLSLNVVSLFFLRQVTLCFSLWMSSLIMPFFLFLSAKCVNEKIKQFCAGADAGAVVSRPPVLQMMRSWTEQMGHPLATVTKETWEGTTCTLEFRQSW